MVDGEADVVDTRSGVLEVARSASALALEAGVESEGDVTAVGQGATVVRADLLLHAAAGG